MIYDCPSKTNLVSVYCQGLRWPIGPMTPMRWRLAGWSKMMSSTDSWRRRTRAKRGFWVALMTNRHFERKTDVKPMKASICFLLCQDHLDCFVHQDWKVKTMAKLPLWTNGSKRTSFEVSKKKMRSSMFSPLGFEFVLSMCVSPHSSKKRFGLAALPV